MGRQQKIDSHNIVLDGDIAQIPLSDGSFATISAADVPAVSGISWYIKITRGHVRVGTTIGQQFVPLANFISLPPQGLINDHRDGDPRNNRRENLRHATQQQNTYNRRPNQGATSKFKGVSFRKDRNTWQAQIQHRGRNVKLGTFANEIDAALAYDAKAVELFGEFAYQNLKGERE